MWRIMHSIDNATTTEHNMYTIESIKYDYINGLVAFVMVAAPDGSVMEHTFSSYDEAHAWVNAINAFRKNV